MSRQLTFDWPNGVSLAEEDFFVSSANADAYEMLKTPQLWPDRKMALIGPTGSGKSHLVRIFADHLGAAILQARDLLDARLLDQIVVIEDLEVLPKDAEETLFHLHNNLRDTGGTLLLTAACAPSRLNISLPDLASRLQATSIVTITDPDDALLSAVLMKLFADRQINVPIEIITYLATRIDRSFAKAQAVVKAIDENALSSGQKISRALVRQVLDKFG